MTAALARTAGSRTTMKRHGWEWPTLGAACPAASTAARISSLTGSGRNRRTSRRAAMTSASAARVGSGRAQLIGSLARSALLVASPTSGRGRGQRAAVVIGGLHAHGEPPGRIGASLP